MPLASNSVSAQYNGGSLLMVHRFHQAGSYLSVRALRASPRHQRTEVT
jgi:hypothetical protein